MNDWRVEHELWAACQGLADEAKLDMEKATKRYERMQIEADAHKTEMERLLAKTAIQIEVLD